jgi:uncharacterized cupredoxin-like copper-binding protein
MNPFTRSVRALASSTALTLVLVACAGGATPAPSASAPSSSANVPAPSASAPGAIAQRVTLADFTIEPEAVTVDGSAVSFDVVNDGPTPHNLTVRTADDEILAKTPDLRRQESASLVAELSPGEYILFCSLAGHESLGMRSSLTVEAP